MSIFSFVKKLLPRIERSTVAEDLRTTEKECVNVVTPSWDSASAHFKINKLSSNEARHLSDLFYQNFVNHKKAVKAPNFILEINRLIPLFHENVVTLQGVLDKYLERDVLSEAMTVRSAFIIRSASNMSMVTRYMMALLNYLYTVEAHHLDSSLEPGLEISKAEMKYVEQSFTRFVKLFSEYSLEPKDYRALVDRLPEVFVNAATQQAVSGLYQGVKFDPFEQYGLSGFVGNPIYRVRLLIARWQNDRYESAKAKKQQLELRLLYLQMKKNGDSDPVLSNEIERLQTRIEGYDRYLREVEESVAEDN